MKKFSHLLVLASYSIFLFACASTSDVTNKVSNTTGSTSESHADVTAVKWHKKSAEYEALCYQAFNVAKSSLITNEFFRVDSDSDLPVAVVLDLDETVLDNSTYNAELIKENSTYTKDSWEEWVAREEAGLVPGAYDFLQFLLDNNVMYFFVSNRSVESLSSTINNLEKLGIAFESGTQGGSIFLNDNSSKTDRRNQIADYQIVMLIGDNLADFSQIFEESDVANHKEILQSEFKEEFGNRFIILPNAMYGSWKR